MWGVGPSCGPPPRPPSLALLPGRVANPAVPHPPAAGWRPSRRRVDSAQPGRPHLPQQLVQNPQILQTRLVLPSQGTLGPNGLSFTELAIKTAAKQAGRELPGIPGDFRQARLCRPQVGWECSHCWPEPEKSADSLFSGKNNGDFHTSLTTLLPWPKRRGSLGQSSSHWGSPSLLWRWGPSKPLW